MTTQEINSARFLALATAIAKEDMDFMDLMDKSMAAISQAAYRELPTDQRFQMFCNAVDHVIATRKEAQTSH